MFEIESHSSPGNSGTYDVSRAGLELMEIHLLLIHYAGIEDVHYHALLELFNLFRFILVHMYKCSDHMCMWALCIHAWYPLKSEEGIDFLGTGVMNGCEPPCWYWELNLGPLQEPESS